MSNHKLTCEYGGDTYEVEWIYTVGHPGSLLEPPEEDEVEIVSIVRNGRFELKELVTQLNECDDLSHPFYQAILQCMNTYWESSSADMYESYREIEDIFDEEAKDQQEQASQ